MATIINPKAFEESMLVPLNNAMLEAAEPIVQKALKEMEVRMRKQLASNLISFITQNFSVESFQDQILIRIQQEPLR